MKELISTFPLAERATPDDLKSAISQWRGLNQQRLEADRLSRQLKKDETLLYDWIIEALQKTGIDGLVVGDKITGLQKGSVLTVTDKEALVEYIRRTGNIFILQFRLSQSTVDEHLAEGEDIPGVAKVETFGLYNRKP
jgi:hypothetical protein